MGNFESEGSEGGKGGKGGLQGGEGGNGAIRSAETRAKMSASAKGKPKGPMSEELKQQISSKLKGKNTHRKGKIGEYKHTLESKAKIAESNRRRIYSAESVQK